MCLSDSINHNFLTHLFVAGHLGCFPCLTTVLSIAVNTDMHTFFQSTCLVFGEEILRSGTAGSNRRSFLNFLINLHDSSRDFKLSFYLRGYICMFLFVSLCLQKELRIMRKFNLT